MKVGVFMDLSVKQISDEVRMKEWMQRIKTCRESGLPVARWCRENNVVEPTYYYWLKKIRKLALDSIDDGGPDIVNITPVVTHMVKNESCASDNKFLKMIKGNLTVEIPVECSEWVLEKVLDKLC